MLLAARAIVGLTLTLTAILGGCASTKNDVSTVRDYLVGSFDSSQQAAEDPEYRVIVLHMAECWKSRTDGPWLYVEQAMAEKPEAPYRQRVYKLVALPDGKVRSSVYELPGPPEEVAKLFAGEWKKPQPLADISPEDLIERDGCAILLTRQPDGSFVGSTGPMSCPSTLRGAAYATSEVTMTQTILRSWDRGFNKNGNQVWGATKGAYVFVKQPK
jgi:hypothetical protein